MTVREMIEKLSKLPQESVIILSSDSEGNNHSPLDEITESRYIPNSTYSGELCDETEGEACVVFYPLN